MPVKRSYADHGDACAAAHGMELIGDRWTHPVLRELMLAPKRFGELEASVRGITPAVLSARLRELEASGLVRKVVLPPPARVAAYELTAWARQLQPIFEDLARWAHGSPTWQPVGKGLTPDGAVQSMLTMAPAIALDPPLALGLHLRELVKHIPANRLMIETDAPYLLPRTVRPQPSHRRNEPMYLAHIVEELARDRGEEVAITAATATATANAFFRLPPMAADRA